MRTYALIASVLALFVAACGEDSSPLSGNSGGSGDGQTLNLTLTVSDGEGKDAKATLKCDESTAEGTGFLESGAEEACRNARDLEKTLTTQPPQDRVCTQIYGGPQTARITGTFGDKDVAREIKRNNGCDIEDWKQAQALLDPSGITPGP
jgi:hypothetical protein